MGRSFCELRLIGEDRIWIDFGGGCHVLEGGHGPAFEDTFRAVTGQVPPPEAWAWMERECGSVPGDDGDNPGWQWVEYAKRVLGWARITVNIWTNKTEIALEFDPCAVTAEVFKAVIALMHYIHRNAPSEVIITDDFGHSGAMVSRVYPDYRSLYDLRRQAGAYSAVFLAKSPLAVRR